MRSRLKSWDLIGQKSFRALTSRAPKAAEIASLQTLHTEQTAHFRQRPDRAEAFQPREQGVATRIACGKVGLALHRYVLEHSPSP